MNKNILSRQFREDSVELLLDAGFSDKEANDLIEKKYKEKLKEESLKILKKIVKLIEDNKFDEVEKMLHFSPAGDGYGCDNMYIDFSSLDPDESEFYRKEINDIGSVINRLKRKKYEEF